jgi:hypothetical protein
MWVFTKIGFFSAVENTQDRATLLVRARVRADIARLADWLAGHGYPCQVHETPERDYRWRVVMPKAVFGSLMGELAAGIDYPNSKDAVHDGTTRGRAYIRIWTAMHELQERSG